MTVRLVAVIVAPKMSKIITGKVKSLPSATSRPKSLNVACIIPAMIACENSSNTMGSLTTDLSAAALALINDRSVLGREVST